MSEKKQIISGVKWTTLATIIFALSGIIKISVLSRFLEKSDFGLIALVMFVLGFMNLFMDMGLTSAILHKQNITKNEYSSLYWLNFVFSIVLFGLVYFSSPFISDFYNQPELLILIPLMATSLIIASIGKQFKTIEQKKLELKTIAIIDISSTTLSLFIAILLAINDFGVYSLVYSSLFYYMFSNVVFLVIGLRGIGINLHYKFQETKSFLKIGIYSVGGDIVNYFNRDLDTLIIGKMFGVEVLGGYNLARQLIRRPLQIIDPVITKITMSIFPKYQDNNKKLTNNILGVLRKLSVLDALIYGGLALFAPLVVRILYGEGYDDIVVMVRLFAVVVYLRSIGGQITPLVIAKGRTDLSFIWNIFNILILPIAIIIGASYGILYVILGLIIAQILLIIPAWFWFYHKLLKMKLSEYLTITLAPMIISIVLFLMFFFFTSDTLVNQTIFFMILTIVLAIYLLQIDNDARIYKNKLSLKK